MKTYQCEAKIKENPFTLTFYTKADTIREAFDKFSAIPDVEEIKEIREAKYTDIV